MKQTARYIIKAVCILNVIVSCEFLYEVCDVEGSGIDDCPVDTHCCRQTECDNAYNSYRIDDNYIDIEYISDTLRCCNESERRNYLKPRDCKICIECCAETERNKVPLPDHCSSCRSCSYTPPTTITTEHSGKHVGFFVA